VSGTVLSSCLPTCCVCEFRGLWPIVNCPGCLLLLITLPAWLCHSVPWRPFHPFLCSYQGGRSLDAFLKFIEEKVAADAGFARVDALVPLAQVRFVAAQDGVCLFMLN